MSEEERTRLALKAAAYAHAAASDPFATIAQMERIIEELRALVQAR